MSAFVEVNFDGLIGPTHNYGGLSLGNVASAANAGSTSQPRAAALQGLAKMRRLVELGAPQGFLPPQARPSVAWLRRLGFAGTDEEVCAAAWRDDPALLRNAISASAMWTANAATVSPAPDTADGRCHLTVANLSRMVHRSLEAAETLQVLTAVFGDASRFKVHGPVPACFGDEGGANHMRLAERHGGPGVEVFVYGEANGAFPARQSRRACEAVARRHRLDPRRCFFARQSDAAIQAGAFHNDVVAVANESVLLAHEQAFAEPAALYDFIRRTLPRARIIEAPARTISLEAAVRTYLFNSQLVTTPDGSMTLVAPAETQDGGPVQAWLAELLASGGPIRRLEILDVRESMRNGGGPACLRLRVCMDEAALATVDPRFLLSARKIDQLCAVVEACWPEQLAPEDLGDPATWRRAGSARRALLDCVQS